MNIVITTTAELEAKTAGERTLFFYQISGKTVTQSIERFDVTNTGVGGVIISKAQETKLGTIGK